MRECAHACAFVYVHVIDILILVMIYIMCRTIMLYLIYNMLNLINVKVCMHGLTITLVELGKWMM